MKAKPASVSRPVKLLPIPVEKSKTKTSSSGKKKTSPETRRMILTVANHILCVASGGAVENSEGGASMCRSSVGKNRGTPPPYRIPPHVSRSITDGH